MSSRKWRPFCLGTSVLKFSSKDQRSKDFIQLPKGFCSNAWSITLTTKNGHNGVKSPASRLFIQPFIQTQIKENIKVPRHWFLCGEFTGTVEFPAQRPVTRKIFPVDDVIMSFANMICFIRQTVVQYATKHDSQIISLNGCRIYIFIAIYWLAVVWIGEIVAKGGHLKTEIWVNISSANGMLPEYTKPFSNLTIT